MKLRFTLVLLCATLFTAATHAQDYKTAIVGNWKCTEVNDSLAMAEGMKMLAEAKTAADSLVAGFVALVPAMMVEMCPTASMTISGNGKLKTISTTERGKQNEESATYKLKGNVMSVTLDTDKSKPVEYIILSLTDKKLVVSISEFLVIMTYTKQ